VARPPRPSDQESRGRLANAIRTPLAFYVLCLLIVEWTISGLILALPDFRAHLVWTLDLSLAAFIIIVTVLAIWRPEALSGDRPLQKEAVQRLGSNLYTALVGAFRGLEPDERLEAWVMIANVITNDEKASETYRKFAISLADTLEDLAHITVRSFEAFGPVRPEREGNGQHTSD